MKQRGCWITGLLLFCLLFLAVISVSAQGTIRGTVLDQKTQEPVIGAHIGIVDSNAGNITAADGTFHIRTNRLPVTLRYTDPVSQAARENPFSLGEDNVFPVVLPGFQTGPGNSGIPRSGI